MRYLVCPRELYRSSDAELTQQLAVLVESLQEEQGIRNSEDRELEEAVRALRLNIEAVRLFASSVAQKSELPHSDVLLFPRGKGRKMGVIGSELCVDGQFDHQKTSKDHRSPLARVASDHLPVKAIVAATAPPASVVHEG